MAVSGKLFHLGEMPFQRLLAYLLQLGIDRGVDPVAFIHGAVPADRGNDLLADVIHRVSLTLRALLAPCQWQYLPPARSRIARGR